MNPKIRRKLPEGVGGERSVEGKPDLFRAFLREKPEAKS